MNILCKKYILCEDSEYLKNRKALFYTHINISLFILNFTRFTTKVFKQYPSLNLYCGQLLGRNKNVALQHFNDKNLPYVFLKEYMIDSALKHNGLVFEKLVI